MCQLISVRTHKFEWLLVYIGIHYIFMLRNGIIWRLMKFDFAKGNLESLWENLMLVRGNWNVNGIACLYEIIMFTLQYIFNWKINYILTGFYINWYLFLKTNKFFMYMTNFHRILNFHILGKFHVINVFWWNWINFKTG